VTVTDHTAPVITVVATVTAEATAPLTPLTFEATSTDLVDGSVPVSCTPASGAGFAVGTTPVNCTATDAHGNSAAASFTVTVTDHTAPALMLPGGLSATAISPAGAVVDYAASAFDLVDLSRPVTCAPASGSTFAIGTTTVACSASDTRGNTASGSFDVVVTVDEEPGRMNGDGTIEIGAVRHEFDFGVSERASGAERGDIRYRVRTKKPGRDRDDRFDATTIAAVTFFNVPGVSPGRRPPTGIDTVSFSGTGRWNGRSGYTFDAVATDAGEPGRGRDAFAITIRDAAGQIVASVNATITAGNIQSLRVPH